MIIVDTGVLSLAFRRKRRDLNSAEQRMVYLLEELLTRGEAALVGPIRQETLSGIPSVEQFERVRDRLAVVPDLELNTEAFETAARFFNICRARGIAAGDVDMMICAAARLWDAAIFTADLDFRRYAQHLPIQLLPI